MSYSVEEIGKLKTGEKVIRYILTNENRVSASFLNLGGIWQSMMVPDREGRMADVVLGYDSIDKWLANPGHCGELVGRNANRIGGAAFTINGKAYHLDKNSSGRHNLHSGLSFYRLRVWESEVWEGELGTSLTLSLFSPDKDQGFPGNANISVTYTLTHDNSVKIDYHMICDADTVANMTNHAYFNLAGHDSGNVLAQKVWIDADFYTPTDSDSIPTGELASVEGTPMDFREMKAIGRDNQADFEQLTFGQGYDHNWALNHEAGELALCAKAEDTTSGRGLEVYTDLPGVQFYTANTFEPEFLGKDGAKYGKNQGFCFETQYFPDAINQPRFLSPLLKAGEEYKATTVYRFYTL